MNANVDLKMTKIMRDKIMGPEEFTAEAQGYKGRVNRSGRRMTGRRILFPALNRSEMTGSWRDRIMGRGEFI